jgi:DNA repair exonuclease SbcCD nuclease subunit
MIRNDDLIGLNHMKTKRVKVIDLSDIHLHHSRTPTAKIIEELDTAIDRSVKTQDIDIIFISGDIFDGLVTATADSLHLILDWIYRLLRRCKDMDIQLRILEGTPSHDWKQSRWFETINEKFNVHADLIYFPALAIEHNTKHNLNILYIPDEWRADTKETYQEVLALMKEKRLEKVDIAIMHGAFTYQLPTIAHGKVPMHNEEDYLRIVKYFIFIGHVHKHSTYERIIAPGSFSRLAHGEEEPKGYVEATIFDDDTFTVSFIENKDATLYKTIEIDESIMTQDQALSFIKASLQSLPKGSHIRIKAKAGHVAIANKVVYLTHFPDYIFTLASERIEKTKEDDKEYDADNREHVEIQQITIDKDNILPLMSARLEAKYTDIPLIARAQSLLVELVDSR